MTEMQADLRQLVQISEVFRKPVSVFKTVSPKEQAANSFEVCVLILREDWHCTGGPQSIWTHLSHNYSQHEIDFSMHVPGVIGQDSLKRVILKEKNNCHNVSSK